MDSMWGSKFQLSGAIPSRSVFVDEDQCVRMLRNIYSVLYPFSLEQQLPPLSVVVRNDDMNPRDFPNGGLSIYSTRKSHYFTNSIEIKFFT